VALVRALGAAGAPLVAAVVPRLQVSAKYAVWQFPSAEFRAPTSPYLSPNLTPVLTLP